MFFSSILSVGGKNTERNRRSHLINVDQRLVPLLEFWLCILGTVLIVWRSRIMMIRFVTVESGTGVRQHKTLCYFMRLISELLETYSFIHHFDIGGPDCSFNQHLVTPMAN